ncbi:MAG: TonB-dependent receptor plug domain-containing protein [Gemmatimonadales bacterium]|nr:TonB-dependent receptor plug domain-containing protein [Gemmatimonadales bacterium]
MSFRLSVVAILSMLLLPLGATAQSPSLHVRGTVRGHETGALLSGARVTLRSARQQVVTSREGAFRTHAAAGEWVVAAQIGFAPDSIQIAHDTLVTFRLRPAPFQLTAITTSASALLGDHAAQEIRDLDLALRPHDSSQELLRLVPGLVIAQHGGGGKAEQVFLRGFDADHGTDVAVSVDGTPVNMVSHAHGQGYADLHFLLPEVVSGLTVRKGPFDVRDGNLATAGAVAFTTVDRLERASTEVRTGAFNTSSGRALIPIGGGPGAFGGYVAAAIARTDGPFQAPQQYRRGNAFAKFTAPLSSATELVFTASGFDATWDASGQIPARAVAGGLISRFGSLDPTEGGSSRRADAAVAIRARQGDAPWQLRAYVVRSDFELYSNFTFFLRDSLKGDGIAQAERRLVGGLQGDYARPLTMFGRTGRLTALAGLRADGMDVALRNQTARVVTTDVLVSRINEANLFAGVAQSVALSDRVQATAGMRGDLFAQRVTDGTVGGAMNVSGQRTSAILSPKLSVTAAVGRGTLLTGQVGQGFHSNDARDVVQAAPRDRVIPRAVGMELSARRTWATGTIAATFWRTTLSSELVFVGDEGVTEASGRTRRVGIDLEGRLRLLPLLWLDADLNLARGRFVDEPRGADRIPLAPTRTGSIGLSLRAAGPLTAGIRVRHIGARPADERGEVIAEGQTVADLSAELAVGRVMLIGGVDNLFNVEWNEAQFATTSRLRGESAPVTELHFTPGSGRALRVGVRVWR